MQNSDWKAGFLFLGNHLALDFLNTLPVQNGEPAELLPDFSALVRWFKAADLLNAREAATLQQQWGQSTRGRRTVRAMWQLREMLRKEVLAGEKGAAVHSSTAEELNRIMADHPMRTRLKARRTGVPATELWFELRQPEDLFAPLAHSAAMLFAYADRSRLRKCGHCVLHFLDTSKKGTRRWCSMRLCGNRFKVAAYAARRRGRAASTVSGSQ
jgi:predicted RNA-binding Zn ribbon-like protein